MSSILNEESAWEEQKSKKNKNKNRFPEIKPVESKPIVASIPVVESTPVIVSNPVVESNPVVQQVKLSPNIEDYQKWFIGMLNVKGNNDIFDNWFYTALKIHKEQAFYLFEMRKFIQLPPTLKFKNEIEQKNEMCNALGNYISTFQIDFFNEMKSQNKFSPSITILKLVNAIVQKYTIIQCLELFNNKNELINILKSIYNDIYIYELNMNQSTQSAPVVVQSAPVVVQSAPVVVQSAPVVVQSVPVVVQSAPVVVQPTPAPLPAKKFSWQNKSVPVTTSVSTTVLPPVTKTASVSTPLTKTASVSTPVTKTASVLVKTFVKNDTEYHSKKNKALIDAQEKFFMECIPSAEKITDVKAILDLNSKKTVKANNISLKTDAIIVDNFSFSKRHFLTNAFFVNKVTREYVKIFSDKYWVKLIPNLKDDGELIIMLDINHKKEQNNLEI